MTAQSVLVKSHDSEDRFMQLYTGYMNGIPNPTREVKHARLIDTTKTNDIQSPTKPTNEGERIVEEIRQRRSKIYLGKINRFGKDR